MDFSKLKLYPSIRPGVSCDYHRLQLPFEVAGFPFKEVKDADADTLVVFNRLPAMDVEEFLGERKRIGFKYVIDVDDFWTLYQGHYLKQTWEHSGYAAKLIRLIQQADGVTVSTVYLADRIKHLNKCLVVVPNGLPFGTGQFRITENGPRHTDSVSMVYAGGASHLYDLKELAFALHTMRPIKNFRFTIAGAESRHQCQWNAISRMFSGVPGFNMVQARPIKTYMDLYDGHDFAIAPLLENEFNNCKSNLKVLEAGAKGIPIICTEILPYANDTDYDHVIYAHKHEDWERAIRQLCRDRSYRLYKGFELARHVRKHYDLNKINETRFKFYEYVQNR